MFTGMSTTPTCVRTKEKNGAVVQIHHLIPFVRQSAVLKTMRLFCSSTPGPRVFQLGSPSKYISSRFSSACAKTYTPHPTFTTGGLTMPTRVFARQRQKKSNSTRYKHTNGFHSSDDWLFCYAKRLEIIWKGENVCPLSAEIHRLGNCTAAPDRPDILYASTKRRSLLKANKARGPKGDDP